ncbi:MAG: chemotaxis protein CheD [Solirubrobacteraceae bacterium]
MAETMVRMGELAFSACAGDVLVSLGLGSCIGLALLDRRAAVAGLAHVVLPAADGRADSPGRFADTAAPVLLDALLGLGARRTRVEAVLVGGASMFSFGGNGLEVGQRNDAAVREALARLRIPIVAAETGGSRGRTVRVTVETGRVTARAAGDTEVELYPLLAVAA